LTAKLATGTKSFATPGLEDFLKTVHAEKIKMLNDETMAKEER
jgi:hypothetical protein